KGHDVAWTGLPLSPDQDAQPRALVPPSTAATLNLAANAAQAARIWKPYDAEFSARCLQAALAAWEAALRHPDVLYLGGNDTGGGAYDDNYVRDDFYWAAVELYLSTGDQRYLPTVDAYVLTRSTFDWAHTELAGLISLATVVAPVTAQRRRLAQARILELADRHLGTQKASAYATPLSATEYEWGSNNAVSNKLMLMGLAYTFSQQRRYADGVSQGMDYLLGRNTFSISFATGTGARAVQHPHHRFWAHVLDPKFPFAPPGALSGGPNSGLHDPVSRVKLAACVQLPASCWLDDINAYAVNEITINWNAPWAWLLDFQNTVATQRVGRGRAR
ncbi:MAG: endoglucanase, partial [Burkholderiales bacterium PBB4]